MQATDFMWVRALEFVPDAERTSLIARIKDRDASLLPRIDRLVEEAHMYFSRREISAVSLPDC